MNIRARTAECIGFLVNEQLDTDSAITDLQLQSIYLPTTPNPTSGFNLLLPQRDIIELDMSVEDGFKFIISMGVIVPDGKSNGSCRKAPALLAPERPRLT